MDLFLDHIRIEETLNFPIVCSTPIYVHLKNQYHGPQTCHYRNLFDPKTQRTLFRRYPRYFGG